MSESLSYCLDQIKESADSIATLYFKPPGIFQNALVHNSKTSYAEIITRLIRDADPVDEMSLYMTDKGGKLRRKDGKQGVYDHLTERAATLKRARLLGAPEETPIVHVPKEFYLKQHDIITKKKQRQNRDFLFDEFSKESGGMFEVLIKKFAGDQQVRNLLLALQNGSVITGEDASSRRKTMFVEDFSVELILRLLREIVTQWPLNEHRTKYEHLLQTYHDISDATNKLRAQIADQEHRLQSQDALSEEPDADDDDVAHPTSGVSYLIQQELDEIDALERELEQLRRDSRT
ncbi:AEL315Wp [Eremothecium gossypii ATCC 10895]|uniref:DASH complex subunit SPC34 n=1 Tax=Eremothecium gossypii (strain ATCC 10895 / CBS 109.51 / FGSC 9923 / NRRL Y-1056) TaxID=284811 RepID=SPC34_EREGS|nr:AEL315Wp [Eremothecium gossypii ATCC 10895]Q758R8.1 RecName: Full=DASH complex subunit SPC34; AltName: Full=Outer kinetochore protein SPC34 [Eremothecium gossypii ATCC 10895]AAS52369.1 AEL315Wp [Eremothecium gossypii ATCC 10895]AEY96666.1 FAEL315Wp [Eremothecium gossypii FDAG1]